MLTGILIAFSFETNTHRRTLTDHFFFPSPLPSITMRTATLLCLLSAAAFSEAGHSGSQQQTGTCETAWIKGNYNRCINTLNGCSNKWGWTNRVHQGATERMEIWAGAGQCVTSKGTLVGYADVSYVNNRVKVTVSGLTSPWVITKSDLWAGEGYLPYRRSKYVSSPGQFPDHQVKTAVYDVYHTTTYVHVALHVDVCENQAAPPTDAPDTDAPMMSPMCDPVNTHNAIVRDMWRPWNTNTLTANDVSEPMLGWRFNEDEVTMSNFPPALLLPGVKVFFPDQNEGVPEGSRNGVKCPENCDNAPCEVITVVYHCPPCSGASNGGFPSSMPVDGWAPGHCAPRFAYPTDTGKHRMVAYRKLVAAGEIEELPETTGILSNYAIFVRQGAEDCTTRLHSDVCTARSECRWFDGECLSNWCVPLPPNGPTECSPCSQTVPTNE